MQQIVKKIIVLLISATISAIVYLLSPKDMFAPVLGLVASTAMVGLCTNNILIKIFGRENQIDNEQVRMDDIPPEYYAQQAIEEELLRQGEKSFEGEGSTETGDDKPYEPVDDATTEPEPVKTPDKSVSFADNIAEYKEYVPDEDPPKRRRRKKQAIQEFVEVIGTDGGESGSTSERHEERIVELNESGLEHTQPEPAIIESPTTEPIAELEHDKQYDIPLIDDGPPHIEDVPEGASESPPASPKKHRRRSRK